MATHKQAEKRNRQNIKRRERNKHLKSTVRSRVKKVMETIESGDKAAAEAALKETQSHMDDAGRKKLFHKNMVSRKISRLTRKVNAM